MHWSRFFYMYKIWNIINNNNIIIKSLGKNRDKRLSRAGRADFGQFYTMYNKFEKKSELCRFSARKVYYRPPKTPILHFFNCNKLFSFPSLQQLFSFLSLQQILVRARTPMIFPKPRPPFCSAGPLRPQAVLLLRPAYAHPDGTWALRWRWSDRIPHTGPDGLRPCDSWR